MPENRDRHAEAAHDTWGAGQRRSPVLRGITAFAGFLLLAAAITACGGAGTENKKAEDPAPVKAANADSPVTANEKSATKIITRGASDKFPGLYAHLSGTLVVTDDNCIAVTTAKSDKPTAVAWGHGWSVREVEGKAVVYDADGKLFAREGDKVGLGGGDSDRFDGKPCATGTVFEANDAQAAS
ncbi:hypothetical protein [Streptomyces roseolus]|uniref:hypothetical protein n=1 Tax=Streptomyces roseolus TaxID=67358 RepID=UPI00167336E9|nr:hypothetical protein [Streptomyces roseolus]GGR20417.1 hypothetical protein GCM10010282_11010 [Streptomyces roseolus]